MKKYLVALTAIAFLAACGGSSTPEKKDNPSVSAEPAAPAANDISANPDYEKGLTLIAKSDCLTCHKTDTKNIGPAYKDVAAKYENNEENLTLLAGKIIKGGSGVWGQVPMTPHPAMTEEDAKQMVKYIFLLRK
ncbi:MAG: cytochrome c class I [Bacteroidetes bacterium 24-39-8]|nr:MAG: cytochrome c class I [Sphingobacteriia bacterium 35-40-8]OYZ53249.1 MAG: cytochrome c class I [Bacteroidetes bacterium 24-39-8]OZA66366.1 MAG: cytochrome c class I [Sphingobacteriia bacterium 39-39-8]HQR91890.1 c-type cytochrome [Sediminibacterium sp.]HQS53523.1 c-type cytochrome [Sediminibacterium sp.]